MQFELTKEYLHDLSEAIAEGRDSFLKAELEELHPADIAEIFDQLKSSELSYLYKLIESEKAAEVMIELDEDDREKLLATLTSKEIAENVIDNIESDDAADVLAELPEEKQAEVIANIEDEEVRSDLSELLQYDEDSAGGIMATELVKVKKSWTIARGIREMRKQAEDIDQVYTIYVTDATDKLVGTLSLKNLLFSSSSIKTPISEIFQEQPLHYVFPDTSGEDCSSAMEKYDLVVLPVVDHDMTLLGRITIDDVVDLIKEEAERDYQLASGISEAVESDDTVWLLTRARLPWLLIGLLGGVLVAQVIGVFEQTLAEVTALMVFVPLIAAMGGNVGVQSSAIVVQGLANNSLGTSSIMQKLTKELMVSLVNGAICGLVVLAYSLLFMDSLALSYTVGISLFSVVIIAALFGTLVPLMLDKVSIDPALATGPFITTMNDIIGLTVYFVYAKFFFGI
ncbi:MAG: magnesium transporter [Flavobacteriales bacterium]|nr:magnesium transporter [Flavobacteriales bacterium]